MHTVKSQGNVYLLSFVLTEICFNVDIVKAYSCFLTERKANAGLAISATNALQHKLGLGDEINTNRGFYCNLACTFWLR